MATDGGGKLKPKRSQSVPKPYERRKSLYSKVTDTVKDLLSPSWLTDIVTTVKKSPPRRTYNTIDEDEDETEMFMSPSTSANQMNSYTGPPRIASQLQNKLPAPQPKRSKVSVPSALKKPAFSSAYHSSSFGPTSRYVTSNHRNSITRPSIREDGPSSSYIPSSYSVQQSHVQQKETLLLNESALQQIKDNLTTGQDVSVVENKDCSSLTDIAATISISDGQSKRPKLWGNETSRQGRSVEPAVRDTPSFKASLFGSPVIDSSLLGDDTLNESSFYCGKTTFGGAFRSRNRLNVTAPYQTALPIRKQMKPKLANSSFNAVTSSSARRILESLERMSTPLTDAKKIPMENPSVTDSLLSFTPSSYRRQSFQPSLLSRRSLEVPSRSGPPTSQIRTHSIASISRNRQTFTSTPIASRLSSLTQVSSKESQKEHIQKKDNGAISTQSRPKKVEDIIEMPSSFGGAGGKMKRDKTHHYSSKRNEDEEVIEIPSLKADFTLPVSNLPQIQFTATPVVKVDDNTAKSIKDISESDVKFSFSSPIHQTKPQNVLTPVGSPQCYTFSSPLKADEAKKGVKAPSTSTVGFSFVSSTPSAVPKYSPLLVNGGVGCEFNTNPVAKSDTKSRMSPSTDAFKPASTLKSGSVMDYLGSGSVSTMKQSSTLKQGSVMDVLGKNSAGSPASIFKQEYSRPGLSNKSERNTTTGQSVPLATLFSKSSGTWTCDTCMIQNNPEKTKCVACETPKPSSKPTGRLITTNKSDKEPLSSLFSKPPGDWTCGTCMVQNNVDKTNCAACETPKPGSMPTGKATDNLSALFKKVEGTWECSTCMVQNKPDVSKCVACETSKPGSKNSGGSITSGSKFESSGSGTITESGFKANVSDISKTSDASVFKSATDYTAPPTGGGFKFVTDISSDTKAKFGDAAKPSTGFSFGSKDSISSDQILGSGFSLCRPSPADQKLESEKAGSDFTFGNPILSVVNKSGNINFGNTDTSNIKTNSGFSLGAQSDSSKLGGNKNLDGGCVFNLPSKISTDTTASTQSNLNIKSSIGGFVFGSDASNKLQETNNNELGKVKRESNGGFTFGQSTNVSNSGIGGFAFGTSQTVQASPKSTADESQIKLPSNFTFGGSTANSNNGGGLGVFPSSSPAVNLTNSFSSSSKRGLDEENTEPKAKKAFTFGGSASTNGPFHFGTTTTESKTSAMVKPETKTAPPVFNFNAASNNQTSNAGFNFSMTASNTSAFSTKPADKPADSVFTFGGGSNTSTSGFGNTSNNFSSGAPAAFGSSASFGGNGSTSGSSIGSTQPAVAPAFGASSAAPAFGASGQTSSFGNSTSFGAPATNMNSGFNFNAANNLNFGSGTGASNFQFPAKPNESGNATTAQTPPATSFVFGAQTPAVPAPAPTFGAPTFGTTGQPGGFNIGTSDSGRKMKKAVRRKKLPENTR